jgi:ubiquinone/menaquinone biosynthesis C-methylase UbiE
MLFDTIAEDYDRARPTYPAALVDRACAGLGAGARVLEVGCGTGKLTRELAGRGFRLEALDPGRAMVAVARRAVGDRPVEFHLGRFEDVELPEAAFDAVFSATAFHWVEPSVGWAKAARLLRPGGTFALLGHVGDGTGPVETRLHEAWCEVQAEPHDWRPRTVAAIVAGAEARKGNISEIWSWISQHGLAAPEAADLFEDAEIWTEPREIDETVDEVIAHIATTSAFLQLDDERRRRLEARYREVLAPVGGYRATIYALLVTARAVPARP